MVNRKNILVCMNVLLFLVMVIHVGIMIYQHNLHPEWSAPAYAELVNAVYYLVPFAVLNLIGCIAIRRQAAVHANEE